MPQRTVQYKAGEADDFGTLPEILRWMGANDIPLHAKLVYAGCGTHGVAFVWEDPDVEPEAVWEVFVQDTDNENLCWGWTQTHEPTDDDLIGPKIENPGRNLEVTWRKVQVQNEAKDS